MYGDEIMKRLRVGVIGLGVGAVHVQNFQACSNADVVAAADLDPNRLKNVGNANDVPNRYTDAIKMIRRENLDVVSIATPNKFHKPLTLAALKAGAHVLCEKPMAMNAAEAKQMLAAAAKAKRRLMINFSYRFTPHSQALKKAVDSGVLGDVYFARTIWHRRRGLPGFGGWFGQKALSGGGPLIDLGVHRLDLALWLMGYPKPTWVLAGAYNPIATKLAKKARKKFDVEDLAVGMIKFDNGATLEIEASWAANIKEKELMETRLLGTKAGLVQRNLNETYEFEAEVYLEKDGAPWDMKLHAAPEFAGSSMAHFVDCIVRDKPHTAGGEEGLIVMELLDAIYTSAAKNKPVQIR
jgi:predicted dehydrogenase